MKKSIHNPCSNFGLFSADLRASHAEPWQCDPFLWTQKGRDLPVPVSGVCLRRGAVWQNRCVTWICTCVVLLYVCCITWLCSCVILLYVCCITWICSWVVLLYVCCITCLCSCVVLLYVCCITWICSWVVLLCICCITWICSCVVLLKVMLCYVKPVSDTSNSFIPPTFDRKVHKSIKHFSSSFSHYAPVLWNSFPFQIRNSPAVASFRKHLKTHLFNSSFPT